MARLAVPRGRTKDAQAAQTAILDAAEAAFAEGGFAGARVDAIARASGYNKSLIFHYFDDKLGLYTAVLQRADRQGRFFQTYILDLLAPDVTWTTDTFRQFVERIVGASYDYYVAHPRLLHILAWEEAEGWTTLEKVVSRLEEGDIQLIVAVLERAQRAGALRPNISLGFILYVLFNACRSYLTSLPLFALIAPEGGKVAPGASDSARQQIVAFVVHGLTVDSTSEALEGLPTRTE